LFIYLYLSKETVLSSQIEGTQSTLSDLLLFEAEEQPGIPLDDVVEVSNYVAALEHGLRRVRNDLPLSLSWSLAVLGSGRRTAASGRQPDGGVSSKPIRSISPWATATR
jgi:Fic family protein